MGSIPIVDASICDFLESLGRTDAPKLRSILSAFMSYFPQPELGHGRLDGLLVPELGLAGLTSGSSPITVETAIHLHQAAIIRVNFGGGYLARPNDDRSEEMVEGRELRLDLYPGEAVARFRFTPTRHLNGVFFICPLRLLVNELGLLPDCAHPVLASFLNKHLRQPQTLRFPLTPTVGTVANELLQIPTDTVLEHRRGESAALRCLAEIGTFLNSTGEDGHDAKPLAGFEEARMLINARVHSPPSIDEIASRVAMSRRRLTQGFKARYGLTVNAYVRQVRMHHARNLLQNEELPITQVARRLGYSAAGNFARDFKREFGRTPRDDRAESAP